MPTGGSCIQCSHMQMHAQKHYLLVGEANYRTKKKRFLVAKKKRGRPGNEATILELRIPDPLIFTVRSLL